LSGALRQLALEEQRGKLKKKKKQCKNGASKYNQFYRQYITFPVLILSLLNEDIPPSPTNYIVS